MNAVGCRMTYGTWLRRIASWMCHFNLKMSTCASGVAPRYDTYTNRRTPVFRAAAQRF
jgi:hypothetical protein